MSAEPGGAASRALMMYSVEPTSSAARTTSCRHSGCTKTVTPGKPAPSAPVTRPATGMEAVM